MAICSLSSSFTSTATICTFFFFFLRIRRPPSSPPFPYPPLFRSAVIRPADATEVVEAWRAAIRHAGGPVALVFTRQKVAVIDRTRYASANGLRLGAYVLADEIGRAHV